MNTCYWKSCRPKKGPRNCQKMHATHATQHFPEFSVDRQRIAHRTKNQKFDRFWLCKNRALHERSQDPLFNHVLSNTEDVVPDDLDGQSSPSARVHQTKGSDITMVMSNVLIGAKHFCLCRRFQQYLEDGIVRLCHTVKNSSAKDALNRQMVQCKGTLRRF